MTSPTSGGALALELHGVRLVLESDLDPFASYVKVAMQPYLREAVASPDVRSRLTWVDGVPADDCPWGLADGRWQRRPDRDLYLADGGATWLRIDDFPDLQMAAAWRDERLELTGRYHFHLGTSARLEPLRRLRHRGRLDALRARRFSTLLYYLVYHPILWHLSRREGWHAMHGAGVAASSGAIVLAGMPGCGKSTLAVALLADQRRRMMSDNLLLYDASRVLSCPELLLLDDGSLGRVGEAARRLVATGERRVYARDAYRPDRSEDDPRPPLAIFAVGRARKTELVRLDPADCAARIRTGGAMAKEVRRIAIMSEVLDLVAGTRAPDERADLDRLVREAPCYALWVAQDVPLARVIDEYVEPALPQAAPHSMGA